METAVQEKLKPMEISSAQTELQMLRFIPILDSAEEVFTHQACGGENQPCCRAQKTTPSLVLRMELLYKTKDINKGFKFSPKKPLFAFILRSPRYNSQNCLRQHSSPSGPGIWIWIVKWTARMLKHRPLQNLGCKSVKVVVSLCFDVSQMW